MLLNCLHHGRECALIKVDDSVQVELRTEEVEEDILAVALVEL